MDSQGAGFCVGESSAGTAARLLEQPRCLDQALPPLFRGVASTHIRRITLEAPQLDLLLTRHPRYCRHLFDISRQQRGRSLVVYIDRYSRRVAE